MSKKNRYGLSRDIPAPIEREVRQNSGFGCVICGMSIYQYEHVLPEFKDAEEHDPEKITLLCGACHQNVTGGLWSKEKVLDAMAKPICKQQGFASSLIDISDQRPVVAFASNQFPACPIPIRVDQFPVIEVKEAEEPGGPFRISANFFNSRGEHSLAIIDNVRHAYESNWDVEAVGKRITIRDGSGQISLRFVAYPRIGITVEKINMLVAGWRLKGDENTLTIRDPAGYPISFSGSMLSGAIVGIQLGGNYLS